MGFRETMIDKLIRLARGDLDLVEFAIRRASGGDDKADLSAVMEIILQRRRPLASPPSRR